MKENFDVFLWNKILITYCEIKLWFSCETKFKKFCLRSQNSHCWQNYKSCFILFWHETLGYLSEARLGNDSRVREEKYAKTRKNMHSNDIRKRGRRKKSQRKKWSKEKKPLTFLSPLFFCVTYTRPNILVFPELKGGPRSTNPRMKDTSSYKNH